MIAALEPLGLPLIVVDDGSPPESFAQLQAGVAKLPWVDLHRHPQNLGKGAAVLTGLRVAGARGFSHAVQIDADGQHRITDIPVMLEQARADPAALVSGCPVYDKSVPASRLHGRKISLFWTRVETWSHDIEDSMCGFRIYPVARILGMVADGLPGAGMEFDAEVLVRAHWAGIRLVFIPTPVTYPPGNISHFRMFRDNVRISAMHTRLFCGMLRRVPSLLGRRVRQETRA